MESIKLICNPMVDFSKYSFDKKKTMKFYNNTNRYFIFPQKKKCNFNVTHIYVFICVYFNNFTVKLNFTLFLVYPKFVIKQIKD